MILAGSGGFWVGFGFVPLFAHLVFLFEVWGWGFFDGWLGFVSQGKGKKSRRIKGEKNIQLLRRDEGSFKCNLFCGALHLSALAGKFCP